MKIDWFTFAAQIVNFVVLVYLLKRFLYGPITRAMKAREDAIATRLQEADERKSQATDEAQRYRALTEQLEHQRDVLFERARADSDEARNSLVAEARQEVQSRREDWLQSLHREQHTLVELVRQRAGGQVVELSRRALTELADVDLEQQTLAKFLDQLESLPANETELLKQDGEKAQVRTAFSVSDRWQEKIRGSLQQNFRIQDLEFVTYPDLICGVELHAGGSKIGWSVQEYLESLADNLQGILASEA